MPTQSNVLPVLVADPAQLVDRSAESLSSRKIARFYGPVRLGSGPFVLCVGGLVMLLGGPGTPADCVCGIRAPNIKVKSHRFCLCLGHQTLRSVFSDPYTE